MDAEGVVHTVIDRTDVEVPRTVRVVRVERTRPVVTVGTGTAETAIVAEAGSGQEDRVAVRSCKQASVCSVMGSPSYCAVVFQFIHFIVCRHSPACAPVGGGCIVDCFQGGKRVGEAVVAVFCPAAIFGVFIVSSVTISVCTPVVGFL